MKSNRYIVICLALFAVALSFAKPCYANDGETRTIKVGFFAFEGYHEINDKGERSGYGYDFLTLMKRYANVDFEYVGYDQTWKGIEAMLLNGEVDMVTSAHRNYSRSNLFSFSMPIGTNAIMLNVLAGNDRFSLGKFDSLDGMLVGILKGSSTGSKLQFFAAENGFTVKEREYASIAELEDALRTGEVDAIATSTLRKAHGEKTVAEFNNEYFYAIVRKDDTELLDLVNAAITQMNANEENWQYNLQYKNYTSQRGREASFTEEERNFMLEHSGGKKKVIVAFDNHWAPFARKEGTEYVGILPDYWKLLAGMTGIEYEFYDSQNDVMDDNELLEGKADIYLGYGSNPSASEDKGFVESSPILSIGASFLTRKSSKNGGVIGVSAINKILNSKLELRNGETMVEFETNEKLVKALRKGEIDKAFLYTFEGDYVINKDREGAFGIQMVPYISIPICAISRASGDRTLIGIVSKCMDNISETEINSAIADNLTYNVGDASLIDFLRSNPLILVIVVLLFLFFIFVHMYYSVKHQAQTMHNMELKAKVDEISELNSQLNEKQTLLEAASKEQIAHLEEIQDLNVNLKEKLDIISNIGYGIWKIELTPSGENRYYANETLEKILGIEGMEMTPEELYRYYHDRLLEDVENIENDDYKDMTGGKIRMRDLVWQHPTKGKVNFTAGGTNYANGDNGNVVISGYLADVTDRKQAEDRSEHVIMSLARTYKFVNYIDFDNHSFSGVTWSGGNDEDIEIRSLNNPDVAVRYACEKRVSPDFKDEMRKFADLSTINERMEHRHVLINQFKDVSGVWHEWAYVESGRRPDGTLSGLIWTLRRIEDEKQAEFRKQQILEDNIAANKAKTRFLQNMSHEIRTPLNALFGFAQLLGLPDGSWTDEEKDMYNRNILNSYNMLDMLIGDIIDISDSEHGNYRIENAEVNVNAVCQNALDSVEYRKPMAVEMAFESDVPDDYVITSDGRRIQQVLINYLTNACKNTEKGSIILRCSNTEHPGRLTFSVTDTGRGVPPEKADAIFTRFTKLNQYAQGSGLGLNICQVIAEKLNGEVYLDKEYTGGARFVFVIDDKRPS